MADIPGILIIAILLASSLGGAFLGFLISKFRQRKVDKQIQKEAIEFLKGNRENAIEVEGIKYPANKFKVMNEEILAKKKNL